MKPSTIVTVTELPNPAEARTISEAVTPLVFILWQISRHDENLADMPREILLSARWAEPDHNEMDNLIHLLRYLLETSIKHSDAIARVMNVALYVDHLTKVLAHVRKKAPSYIC